MTKLLRGGAKRVLLVILALSVSLSLHGCLPYLLYDSITKPEEAPAQLTPTEIIPEGSLNELSYQELSDRLFEFEILHDNLSLNQLVEDPAALQLEVPRPATLGDYSYEATREDNHFYSEVIEALTNGEGIAWDSLSASQAREADYLIQLLTLELRYEEFYYYDEPLSPSTGAQATIPLNLMDYQFRTIEDIDIYLEILQDLPRYFDQLITHEHIKREQRLLMAREAMEVSIEEAKAYCGTVDTHILTSAFDEMLDEALDEAAEEEHSSEGVQEGSLTSLSIEDIALYKERNRETIASSVIPAYQKLVKELEAILPECEGGIRLYDYPRGTEYYELELESLGFYQTPSEAATVLETAMEEYWVTLSASYTSGFDSTIPEEVVQTIGERPEDYLSYIQQHSTRDFADASDLPYQVKVAPDASPNDYAMAYFLIPPVDNPRHNSIVFFPRNISDDVELYSTMAHEGYPGHMYQIYSYSLENPSNLGKIIGCLAYMEGWAMYAQAQAMYYLDVAPEVIDASVAYDKFVYALQARIDIGVNYQGWDIQQTEEYLSGWGFESAASGLFEVCLQQPIAYLPYGMGVISFDKLRSQAMSVQGTDFDAIAFHQKITSVGPFPLETLEEEMNQWISQEQAQFV